ncbi:MAG: hypothetical protein U0974_03100 [Gemmatimonadales bacterium]|nr:hypothetical protein [Gemmatimonadales bacterium]MDZ4388701.1 hypothetical protein [Gemmatimonadales bacterium]
MMPSQPPRSTSHMRLLHLVFALGVSTSAACGARDTPQGIAAEVPQTIHARSAYDVLPVIALVPVRPACAVDALDCSPGGEVKAVADSEGRLLVWSLDKALHEIAGEGSPANVVGRVGGGPGEYQKIWAAGFSRSGELLAFDPLQQRLLRYDRSGSPMATSQVELPPGFIDASFVAGELRALAVDHAGGSGGPDSASVSVFALEPDGKKPRRLFTLPVRQLALAIGEMTAVPGLFAARPQWQVLADGQVLYSPGTALLVHRYDETGAPVLHAGFDAQPREVTEDEAERSLEAVLRQTRNSQMRDAMRASQAGRVAERQPAITALRQLENGQIWMREAPRAAGDSVRWLVLDSAGAPVGSVMLDTESRVLTASQGLILVSQPGAVDPSESLVWMRVAPVVGSTTGAGGGGQ